MTQGHWEQIKRVFETAVSRQGADRAAFLAQACGGDAAMRRELERLLSAHDEAGSFLQQPGGVLDLAEEIAHLTPNSTDSELIGTRIGRYSITGLIGKGGMGAVYRAVREDDFQMEVAIKLLKRGTDTEAALSRFRVERQILAGLRHPNIAALLDGGATETGLPYLVMEFVEGTSLLEYSGSRSVRQRLELFRSVCSAVQYAHDRKIVHRDIKPANILVTVEGIPKLLDFGIAKLLDPAADDLTVTGMRLMTPDYASPEQMRGEPLTTATDVYSLGAVLFELVTGERLRTFRTRGKRLDIDLTNIIRKAMREEPERRYASVQEFSDDLDRYLHDMPIKARKESVSYRGRKFIKRNRALITAAALSMVIGVAMVIGIGRIGGTSKPTAAPLQKKDQRWDHLKFEKIASLGDQASGGGVFTKYFEPWALNNGGDLTFVAEVSSGKNEGLFLWRKGEGFAALPLALPGQPAPGGGILEGASFGYASLNDAGDVAFVYGLKPLTPPDLKGFEKTGLYRYSHTDREVIPVVVPGVTLAPGFGVFQSTNQHATLNSFGDIVFPGVVRTNRGIHPSDGLGQGIFLADRNGRIRKVVAPGDPAPGGVFDFTTNPWINDRGDVAFDAHVAGEECIDMGPGRCAGSVYLKSAGTGAIESIAHQGEQAPLANRYQYAWGPVLNNRGEIVFIGQWHPPPGVRALCAIYLHSRGVTIPVAMPGEVMPDGRRIVNVVPDFQIGNYSLNNRGDVTFNASLENGESALHVYSQSGLHLVAGTGTVIPGLGTISSVVSLGANGGMLNDSGQIVFSATLRDGKGVLLLATPSPR